MFKTTNSNAIICKTKIFSKFFSAFLKSTSNFQQFGEKDEPHSWSTSEIRDCKKCGYLNAEKPQCQNSNGHSAC